MSENEGGGKTLPPSSRGVNRVWFYCRASQMQQLVQSTVKFKRRRERKAQSKSDSSFAEVEKVIFL